MKDIVKPPVAVNKLPWWTWVAPYIILHAGSEVSVLLKYDQGVTAFYLPTALSVIMIHWWGTRRVLPAVFINATLSTSLWGVTNIYLWPLYAFPETLFTLLSRFLFAKLAHGKYWLPDNKNLLLFLLLGITIPVVIEIVLLESLQIYFGDQSIDNALNYTVTNLLSEFISNFGLSIPVLYYLSPIMNKKKLLLYPEKIDPEIRLNNKQFLEIVAVYSILLLLVFSLKFDKFWFIYGLLPLYAAIRFGFGQAVLMNGFIFLITYIFPLLLTTVLEYPLEINMDVTAVYLGVSLLFIFSAITGHVISDLKVVEEKLTTQNKELEQTNKELDRFVYSVSHDLSAPLKSILGLVNISRLSTSKEDHNLYISKIETSVLKLDSFIKEILDYSKNKRQELTIEQIQLQDLCSEILENLRFMEGYQNIQVDTTNLLPVHINNDKSRLKIILNNLLTNAIKFQKKVRDHRPYIKISSQLKNNAVFVHIEDNGEGIPNELQSKIFDMFFRGNQNTRGSGLGLYIAKEAAEKIKGKISFQSHYGKGSTFIIELHNLN